VAEGDSVRFIGADGQFMIEPRFDLAREFSEGLAAVRVDDSWGFIDTDGEFVIEPRYQYADSFSENRAAVAIGDEWAYVDQTGYAEVPPGFDLAKPFENGLAIAACGEEFSEDGLLDPLLEREGWRYIDEFGGTVWEATTSASEVSSAPLEVAAEIPPWDSAEGPEYMRFEECDRSSARAERPINTTSSYASFSVNFDFDPPCDSTPLSSDAYVTYDRSLDVIAADGARVEVSYRYFLQDAIGLSDVGDADHEFRTGIDVQNVVLAVDGEMKGKPILSDRCSAPDFDICRPSATFAEGEHEVVFTGTVDCGGDETCSIAHLRLFVSAGPRGDEPPIYGRTVVNLEILEVSVRVQ
jgi:hypothetical protein